MGPHVKITAPWSPEQVAALNKWQQLGYVHEFTCPHGHGPLTAQRDFWMCLRCGYTQEWAHDFMCDVAKHPKNPLAPKEEDPMRLGPTPTNGNGAKVR